MLGLVTKRGTALRALLDGLHLDPDHRGSILKTMDSDAWMPVISLANEHLLAPALGSALRDNGVSEAIPDDARAYLELLRTTNADRNAIIRGQAIEILAALNERGVQPLILKGALTLFADPDRDPAARMMADIDIVVPTPMRVTAEDTLDTLGYRISDRYPEGHHAVGEFQRDGDPAAVDLHLELIDQRYILPAATVLEDARPMIVDGATVMLPSATHRVLHVLLHAQTHHLGNYYRGHVSLGQVLDFATIVSLHRRDIDWYSIEQCMREHRLIPALDSYLVLAKDLFGLPWPLSRAPGKAGQRHARRCLLQLHLPILENAFILAGNVQAAFAWHRMRATYGNRGGPLVWHGLHTWQYLKRHDVRQAIARLFR